MKVKLLKGTKFLSLFEVDYDNGVKYMVASRDSEYHPNKDKVDAVHIFAVNKERTKVLLTKEFRYAVNQTVIGTPAGLVDDNETLKETALRELKEETGCKGKILFSLPPTFSTVGLTNERTQIFIVEVDTEEQTDLQDIELIDKLWVNKEEAKEILLNNKNLCTKAQMLLVMFLNNAL